MPVFGSPRRTRPAPSEQGFQPGVIMQRETEAERQIKLTLVKAC